MLIYSNSKNLIPKWVWCGGLSPHRCAWCCSQWFLYLLIVTCWVLWLILYYYSVYIIFYFELADDTYSVRVPCTDPYLYFLLCSFVECSKCTIDFDSPSALASLQHIRVQGEVLILARAGFSHSRLDVFEFWNWTIFLLIFVS